MSTPTTPISLTGLAEDVRKLTERVSQLEAELAALKQKN